MQQNHCGADEERHEDVEPDAGEDECDDGEHRERGEEDAVVEGNYGAVEEEEEEEPGGEDGEEDDEGEWVPEEAEEEDEEGDQGVVHAEVAEVAPHAECGVAE